jgi:hypothetical protein
MINRRFRHYQTTHMQGCLIRDAASDFNFSMPTARPMREPGTNFLTYITAEGPITYHPGV